MSKTLFFYRGNMQARVLGKADEQGPFDFLYGYDRFTLPKACVVAPRGVRPSLGSKALYLVEKPFAMATKLGLPLEIQALFPREIARAETIFCVNDAISLAMLFHKALGRVDAKLVVLMQSLSERLRYFRRNSVLVAGISRLLRAADTVLALSETALVPLAETFGVPQEKLKVFRFGIDANYWTPDPAARREDFILAVGNDMNRDYETLLRALPSGMELRLVTSRRFSNLPPGVRVLDAIADASLRRLYQTARCVVIPSGRLRYESSGLSSIMQALACGAPVLASYSPAHREYFDAQEAAIRYFEPGNAAQLCEMLRTLPAPPPGSQSFQEYTTAGMAWALEQIIVG